MDTPETVTPVEKALIETECVIPWRPFQQDVDVRHVGQPVFMTGYLQLRSELVGYPGKWRRNGGDLSLQTAYLAASPVLLAESGNRYSRSRQLFPKYLGGARFHSNLRVRKVRSPKQLGPVNGNDAFLRIRRPRHDFDTIPELVGREPAKPFFPKRQAAQTGPLVRFPLPRAMVVSGDQPDVADGFQRHAFAVILDNDRRPGIVDIVQDHAYRFGIGVVSIFYQLEDGNSRRTDEFVSEELKNARTRPERQIQRLVSRKGAEDTGIHLAASRSQGTDAAEPGIAHA